MNTQGFLQEFSLMIGVTPDLMLTMLTSLAAFTSVLIAGRGFMAYDRMGHRLHALQARRDHLRADMVAPRRRPKMVESVSFMQRVVQKLNLMQEKEVEKISRLMVSAGIRQKEAVIVYMFIILVAPFIALGVSLLFVPVGEMMATKYKLFYPVLSAYAAYKAPYLYIVNKRDKRRIAIRKGMADGLDLMMVCAEAGLTLGATLERVSRQLQISYPELADELALTSVEIGFLPDRKTALENLHKRTGIAEIKALTNVLIQTEKYGTPIAQALRTLSSEFRTQRLLRAEDKAARLPALMTVPMIVFILPCLFIVIITPAALSIYDEWING